jgi:hypothetical protein
MTTNYDTLLEDAYAMDINRLPQSIPTETLQLSSDIFR